MPYLQAKGAYVVRMRSKLNKQENNKQESNEVPAEDVSTSLNEIVAETDPKTSEKPVDISTGNVNTEMSMDVQEDQGRKR